MNCPIHQKPPVMVYPCCLGSVKSKAKAEAARANGKLGGAGKHKKKEKQS